MFISVDPTKDKSWTSGVPANVVVDGVHTKDASVKKGEDELALSEGVKRLKPLILRRIVDEFNMNQCMIFCRTNLDCDNLEKYLTAIGGGSKFRPGTRPARCGTGDCETLTIVNAFISQEPS